MGTITEIHDYLRLLFARVGEPRCPDHDVPLAAQTVSQMVDNVLSQPEGKRLMLLARLLKSVKANTPNAGKSGKPGLHSRPY
ncbi:excision nuclease subunit A [Salmonella enterica subsp. enterica]|uniref:Excision nuclease subunit A n=1 Tax=Salmonella enterica I TaxID=59201 RepID=A0A379WGJ7_SALET|nr:excision nuclease subunit A [Salmonella enterica subsp. enterica]